MPYCVMVKLAMTGKALKAKLENFGCLSSARALGIIEPDEMFSPRAGIIIESACIRTWPPPRISDKNMTMCQHKAHGVMIKPVEEFQENPDVVLMVVNPYNAMRIIQSYTHVFGYKTSFQMAGNQAICSEATAYPFENNTINVSMLCSGTRYMAGWSDTEMAIGFVFNKFQDIVKGLWTTVNPIEPNVKKKEIEVRIKENNITDLEIEYDRNYYTGLYLS